MECKNEEQRYIGLSIRNKPSLSVSQLLLSFYPQKLNIVFEQFPLWTFSAYTYLCFPRLYRSRGVCSAFSQQLSLTKRTVKNDWVLTHTVMSSTCALLLPFLSLFLLTPSPPTPLPPTLISPPFLLPSVTPFLICFLPPSLLLLKTWFHLSLTEIILFDCLRQFQKNCISHKSGSWSIPSVFLIHRRRRRSTCSLWTT